jgi:hypothetical protein
MLGPASRWVRRAEVRGRHGTAAPPRTSATPRPRVDVRGCAPSTRARLVRLACDTGAYVIGDADASDPEVVVVTLGEADGHRVAELRRAHRVAPGRRTVVIGEGTTWFDAAFAAGVDAWIDHTADDATVLTALLGGAR